MLSDPLFANHSATPAMPPSPLCRSLFILLAAALLAAAYSQSTTTFPNCDRTFSCGDITNVSFPFTGGDRPSHCGLPEFALTCRDNSITELTDDSVAYRVLRIDQTQKTLILSRSDLYNNTCPSAFRNVALNTTLFSYRGPQNEDLTLFYGCNTTAMTINPYNLFRCNSSRFNFPNAYYITGPVPNDPILKITRCSVNFSVALLRDVGNQLATQELTLHQALMQGFSVNYIVPHERWCSDCKKSGGECRFDSVRGQPVCICGDTPCPVSLMPPPATSQDAPSPSEGHQRSLKRTIVGLVVGGTCIILIFIIIYWYIKRRRSPTRSNQECSPNLEKILHEQGSLAPKRYKYSEIKKITKSFSHKLGQGGYGCVYKGMLPNGSLVAVKFLFETKGNGEEFINEVAAISKTSHVNIVNLLGFCYDRSKRALVYEFMPNKSLDKFISNGGSSRTFEVSLINLMYIAME